MKIAAFVGDRHHAPGDVVEVADDHRAGQLVALGHAEMVMQVAQAQDQQSIDPKQRTKRAVVRK